jgi:hypothetical protein
LNFFEKEQEKLHNGEIAAYIPGTSEQTMAKVKIVSDMNPEISFHKNEITNRHQRMERSMTDTTKMKS